MSKIAMMTAAIGTCLVLGGGFGGHARGADFYWSYYAPDFCYASAPVEWVSLMSPVYYDPCTVFVVPPDCVATTTTPGPYATPRAAPPSSTGPAQAPTRAAPKVSESRSFYYGPDASTNGAREPGDVVTVTFWNLSEQDLALMIEGRAQLVSRGQNVRADVQRQFLWRVEGRGVQAERIPDAQRSMEIVIRE